VSLGSNGDKPAIAVNDVTKRFRLYKDKPSSLKQVLTGLNRSRYEEFVAVDGVSLEIPHGGTYGIVGHNGSGKSTLLRLMAGIHRPTTGSVETDGRISALLELGAGFHPDLTGRENIYLNGAILGLGRREVDAVIDQIIDFSGISAFIDSPVKVYSSGMYVRLGFAVAVHVNPQILIIDEVIAVGDEEFQRRCYDHIYELRRNGVTIVIVSHAHDLVQSMCDRAAWLDHGKLMAEGNSTKVVRKYLDKVNADEEERLYEEAGDEAPAVQPEDDDGGRRRGSGELLITGVEFLGLDGQATMTGTTGDPITIRIMYEAKEPVKDPVFGLGVHHDNGTHVAGPNTRFGGLDLGTLSGTGHIDFVLDRLSLLPGTYQLSVSAFDNHVLHPYDFRDQAFTLHVRQGSSSEEYGLVDLGGHWSR
jgi:ABC-2 type transport system ATP-binding protein/lipopolysaccharide transport system ATP-binding protein